MSLHFESLKANALFFHIFAQFVYIGLSFNHFIQERPPYLFALGIFSMLAIDVLLDHIFPWSRRPASRWVVVAIANSVYLSAEIYGRFNYPLFFGVLLANLIRRFARIDGHGVFNPSLSSLFLLAVILPQEVFVPGRWQVNGELAILTFVLGGFVSLLSGSLAISVSYLLGLSSAAMVLVADGYFPSLQLPWQDYWQIPAGLVHAGTAIYAFHVVSDPGTSPRTIGPQIIFGLLIGFFEMSFRLAGFSPLVPVYLFITLGYALIRTATLERHSALATSRP